MEGELILTDKGLKKIKNDDNRELVKRFFNLEKYEKINYKLMSNYIYCSKNNRMNGRSKAHSGPIQKNRGREIGG